MNIIQIELITIACLTALACVLPGIFLVLRGSALMCDAISHSILPGIVLMFLWTLSLSSPWLIIGASLAGIATVFTTETLINSQRLKYDAALGLVFPLFFSVGIILISLYARTVHLDMDMVLLGHLIFTPFSRLIIWGIDCGSYALWSMTSIACINGLFIFFFYKELKLATFDPTLAHLFSFYPTHLYYGLMTITSITCVCAFNVVGSIVVVALMIAPAAAAALLTKKLNLILFLSIFFGFLSAIGGYILAFCADVSIAGSIATVSGIIFLSCLCYHSRFFFYPQKHQRRT